MTKNLYGELSVQGWSMMLPIRHKINLKLFSYLLRLTFMIFESLYWTVEFSQICLSFFSNQFFDTNVTENKLWILERIIW